jgi:hypothetical protein
MMRSAAAVIGGFLAYAFLMGFTVLVLQTVMPGAFGPATEARATWAMVVEILYSVVFAAFGGYVTGLIARRAEVGHAAILAALILLIGVWSISVPLLSVQYGTLMLVLAAMFALFGGYIRARQTARVMA